MTDLFDDGALQRFDRDIGLWLHAFGDQFPIVAAIDRDEGDQRRWYVRLRGEEKEFITVWLTLGQRTLQYEAYVMPAPEENAGQVYEQLLRRNHKLVGLHFAIGIEDAVFVRGDIPLAALMQDEFDRILGSIYATVEQCYMALLRLGFAGRFKR